MKSLVLIGGGGHCRSCIEVIESTGRFKIEGIIDNEISNTETCLGYPVIGSDAEIDKIKTMKAMALITIGQINSPDKRKNLYELLNSQEIETPVIKASSSIVSRYSLVKEGSIIMHGAVVNACANIGINTIINSMALIEHDAQIGDHCHISTGARINGNVEIGDGCFVGSGAIIYQNIKIARKSVIPAGAVISNDVSDGELLRGVS